MSDCPSCGRYAGPHEACPHCGARLGGRTSIRTLKLAALLLASIGLITLWLAATRAEIPQVSIGEASAALDMAYVRLSGVCSRASTYDPQRRTLAFWMADPTGEIYVVAYRAQADEIADRGQVPSIGDLIVVAGTLGLREDFASLTIHVAAHLEVSRPEPVERAIGSLSAADEYSRVSVRGAVRHVYQPYDGLTLVGVRDESGSIDIALGDATWHPDADAPALAAGQALEVVAAVALYEGEPQLVPASTGDITLLDHDPAIASVVTIGQLATAEMGRFVAVHGTVVTAHPFSAGAKYTLDDGTGTVVLLLWSDLLSVLPDQAELRLGAEVEAQGELSSYQGELQVVPELRQDVRVVTAAPAVPTSIPIGTLTGSDEDRWVTVRGTLGQPEPFSSGVKYDLSDDTGSIVLLLWQEVYDELSPTNVLFPGAQVEVRGRIDSYQDVLEIIPDPGGVAAAE